MQVKIVAINYTDYGIAVEVDFTEAGVKISRSLIFDSKVTLASAKSQIVSLAQELKAQYLRAQELKTAYEGYEFEV